MRHTGLPHDLKPILRHSPTPPLFPSGSDMFNAWSTLFLSVLLVSVLCSCDSGQTSDDPGSIQKTQQKISLSHQDIPTVPTAPSGNLRTANDAPIIVAFGDSLTAGLGITQDLSYPAQLQQRIRQAGYDYQVINAGVNGDTTAGGLRRVEWVLKSRPSIVILELGANDGLRGQQLEETSSNLEQIIQRFQEEEVTVILAGMKIPPNYGLDYTSRFSEMYQTLANHYQIAIIPFFLEGVAAIPSLNQADGIHPTAQGYTLVVENVMNVLEPKLMELRQPR